MNDQIVNKRKHKRYRAKEGAFALIRNQEIKLGQILDISSGGLGFKYMANGHGTDGFSKLDIFLSKSEFHLRNIAFETVSDIEITRESPISFVRMRRRGVQFSTLTQSQQSHLKFFIQQYTVVKNG